MPVRQTFQYYNLPSQSAERKKNIAINIKIFLFIFLVGKILLISDNYAKEIPKSIPSP